MRRVYYLLVFMLFCGNSQATAPADCQATPTPAAVLLETVHWQEKEFTLCVINNQNSGAEWFILNKGIRHKKITETPNAMSQVVTIKASPSRALLAILSVGEGHPVVDIVDLPLLLQNKPPKTIISVNPYPGTININKWENDDLIVESDRLLTHSTGEEVYALDMYQTEKFILHAQTGKITALSPNAQDPVQYYAKLLVSKDEAKISEVIKALVSLGSPAAIPALQNALQQQNNPDLREELYKAIVDLRQ